MKKPAGTDSKPGSQKVRFARIESTFTRTPFVPFTPEDKAIMKRVVGPPAGVFLRTGTKGRAGT